MGVEALGEMLVHVKHRILHIEAGVALTIKLPPVPKPAVIAHESPIAFLPEDPRQLSLFPLRELVEVAFRRVPYAPNQEIDMWVAEQRYIDFGRDY